MNDGYKIWMKDGCKVWIKDPTRTILPPPSKANEMLRYERLKMEYEFRRKENRDDLIYRVIIWTILILAALLSR
jgi:hypothetical protein